MNEIDYSDALIQLQELTLQLNEDKKHGLKEVPVEIYEVILNSYIDTMRSLEDSHVRFNEVVEICKKGLIR